MDRLDYSKDWTIMRIQITGTVSFTMTSLHHRMKKSRRRILESAELMDEETRTLISRIRNGVETVPSVLRNKYAVDKMPMRGKLKTKLFFGFKVATLNFSKLMRFTQGKLKCRSFEPA
ncbi:hypothetical protein EAI89_19325 [Eubacterium sp. am_0171]|nr:hypothetical protein [Eubacterium sp. BIOML-A1]MSD08349.1 hypothetical protein [Eubacterium sp. BIOML-A2]RYT12527.1 hypothetical protein EAI89_19325 [Eubacterium sp. am_0171]